MITVFGKWRVCALARRKRYRRGLRLARSPLTGWAETGITASRGLNWIVCAVNGSSGARLTAPCNERFGKVVCFVVDIGKVLSKLLGFGTGCTTDVF